MTPSFPTRRSSDLLSRRRRSAKFERGRHLADRGGAANRRHPLARKADDRQYCAQLRDQSRQADSRLSRTLSLQRRRGVERAARSEEHTSELQSLMRSSYAVFCLKKKN